MPPDVDTHVEVIKGQTEDQTPPENEIENIEEQPKNEVTEILREIDKKLTPKTEVASGPTAHQIYAAKRESLKEKFGWNDSQVDAYEADKAESIAPLKEELAWTKLKSEASALTPEIEEEMKSELSQYPAHLRGDKVLLEKIYYMALGRKSAYTRTSSPQKSEPSDRQEENVVSRRVVSVSGSTTGLGGGGSSSRAPKLTDDEKIYARKMKMSEEEYDRYKSNDPVESFRKK